MARPNRRPHRRRTPLQYAQFVHASRRARRPRGSCGHPGKTRHSVLASRWYSYMPACSLIICTMRRRRLMRRHSRSVGTFEALRMTSRLLDNIRSLAVLRLVVISALNYRGELPWKMRQRCSQQGDTITVCFFVVEEYA